jgi:diguanylate cyclase (GGDEF)-like protein/PAS domain S-box-containing protein
MVGLLGAVAASANESTDPLQLLRRAVRQVSAHTGWPVGHAYLVDADGTLTPTTVWSGSDEAAGFAEASASIPLPAGAGLPGRVAATGQPAWIEDIEQDANFPRGGAAAAAGLRAAFAFPVLVGPQVVGVLEFFSRTPVEPDTQLLDVAAAIGTQLGRAFERDSARRQAAVTAERAQRVLDGAGDAFVAMDAAGLVTGWNEQAERLFGWSRDEAMGRAVTELIIPEEYRADHDEGLRRFLATGEARVMGQRLEMEALRRSGEVFPIEMSFWSMRIGEEWSFYAFGCDITDRKAREAELAHRALHDELTGLANRSLAVDRITQALARRERAGGELAVLFVDLDRFKIVNDSLGHDAGDRLLQAVAGRLVSAVRPADTVARVAGDEFVVVCDALPEPAEATRIAQRILDVFGTPVDLVDDRVRAGVSIGIALAGAASDTAEDLLRDADAAMYRAKEHGRGQAEIFDDGMRTRIRNRLRTEQDLAGCIEQRQLRLHYQPIVELPGQRVVGVEALVRWQHPERGLLPPAEFIDLAEDSGMIVPIGTWVLEEACRQARSWQEAGCRGLRIAVNLSARQLTQSGFVETAAAILKAAELDPDRVQLDLEVTETLLMSDPDATARTLGALRQLGVGLSIDDFGTGYSSLAYLKWFPVDVVKIDRSFVAAIDTDPRDLAIVQAVVELGHALDLTVLAEGVETQAHAARLADAGCDLAQGYHFARPAPADEITRRLLAR